MGGRPEHFLSGRVTLYPGDCREVIAGMADHSTDSVVTDPPYALVSVVKRFGQMGPNDKKLTMGRINHYQRVAGGFMNQKWDTGETAFAVEFWAEVFRVLKPGGHVVSFGGTRTYHRLVSSIEDAGFEIRDTVSWLYGSGFPKSHNVSKGIDKAAPRVGMFDAFAAHFTERLKASGKTQKEVAALFPSKTGGLTGCVWNWANGANVPTLAQWEVLQPLLGLSFEWLPLIERIEAEREIVGEWNMPGRGKRSEEQKYGLTNDIGTITAPATDDARQWQGWGTALKPAWEPICLARKPLSEGTVAANVLAHGTGALNIDGCRVAHVTVNGGNLADNPHLRETINGGNGGQIFPAETERRVITPNALGRWPANLVHDGSDEVLAGFPESKSGEPRESTGSRQRQSGFAMTDGSGGFGDSGSAARFFYTAKADAHDRLGSKHPTVKPLDLMQWLVRLVTPKGGMVLDPFAGTGTTGEAAWREGFSAVLIEREPDYCAEIRRRMALARAPMKRRAVAASKGVLRGAEGTPLFDGYDAAIAAKKARGDTEGWA